MLLYTDYWGCGIELPETPFDPLLTLFRQNKQVFIAMAVNLITVTFPVVRSAISKEAPPHKIGAIFAGM